MLSNANSRKLAQRNFKISRDQTTIQNFYNKQKNVAKSEISALESQLEQSLDKMRRLQKNFKKRNSALIPDENYRDASAAVDLERKNSLSFSTALMKAKLWKRNALRRATYGESIAADAESSSLQAEFPKKLPTSLNQGAEEMTLKSQSVYNSNPARPSFSAKSRRHTVGNFENLDYTTHMHNKFIDNNKCSNTPSNSSFTGIKTRKSIPRQSMHSVVTTVMDPSIKSALKKKVADSHGREDLLKKFLLQNKPLTTTFHPSHEKEQNRNLECVSKVKLPDASDEYEDLKINLFVPHSTEDSKLPCMQFEKINMRGRKHYSFFPHDHLATKNASKYETRSKDYTEMENLQKFLKFDMPSNNSDKGNSTDQMKKFQKMLPTSQASNRTIAGKVAQTPSEILNTRYLRLTESNIKQLEKACRLEGKDPGIHAHMTPTDVEEYFSNLEQTYNDSESISELEFSC